MMHFTYQTKNHITGKTYVGVHSTDNLKDGYKGSGEALKKSMDTHGRKNFTTIPLEFFNSRQEAEEEEEFLVDEAWVKSRDNYNIALGGNGNGPGRRNSMFGKTHTPETLTKMSASATGRISGNAKEVTVDGVTYTSITALAKSLEVSIPTIYNRVKKGTLTIKL